MVVEWSELVEADTALGMAGIPRRANGFAGTQPAIHAIASTRSSDTAVMDLKYCERCGGLWLRRRDSEEVYCSECGPKMAAVKVSRRGSERSESGRLSGDRVEVRELMAVSEGERS